MDNLKGTESASVESGLVCYCMGYGVTIACQVELCPLHELSVDRDIDIQYVQELRLAIEDVTLCTLGPFRFSRTGVNPHELRW